MQDSKWYGIRCDDPKDRLPPDQWQWLCDRRLPLVKRELSDAQRIAARYRGQFPHARAALYGKDAVTKHL